MVQLTGLLHKGAGFRDTVKSIWEFKILSCMKILLLMYFLNCSYILGHYFHSKIHLSDGTVQMYDCWNYLLLPTSYQKIDVISTSRKNISQKCTIFVVIFYLYTNSVEIQHIFGLQTENYTFLMSHSSSVTSASFDTLSGYIPSWKHIVLCDVFVGQFYYIFIFCNFYW